MDALDLDIINGEGIGVSRDGKILEKMQNEGNNLQSVWTCTGTAGRRNSKARYFKQPGPG